MQRIIYFGVLVFFIALNTNIYAQTKGGKGVDLGKTIDSLSNEIGYWKKLAQGRGDTIKQLRKDSLDSVEKLEHHSTIEKYLREQIKETVKDHSLRQEDADSVLNELNNLLKKTIGISLEETEKLNKIENTLDSIQGKFYQATKRIKDLEKKDEEQIATINHLKKTASTMIIIEPVVHAATGDKNTPYQTIKQYSKDGKEVKYGGGISTFKKAHCIIKTNLNTTEYNTSKLQGYILLYDKYGEYKCRTKKVITLTKNLDKQTEKSLETFYEFTEIIEFELETRLQKKDATTYTYAFILENNFESNITSMSFCKAHQTKKFLFSTQKKCFDKSESSPTNHLPKERVRVPH